MFSDSLSNTARKLRDAVCELTGATMYRDQSYYMFLAYVCTVEELAERGVNAGLAKNLASLHYQVFVDSGACVNLTIKGFVGEPCFYVPHGFSRIEKKILGVFVGNVKALDVKTETLALSDPCVDYGLRKRLAKLALVNSRYINFLPLSLLENFFSLCLECEEVALIRFASSVIYNPPRSIFDENMLFRFSYFGAIIGEPHGGSYCYFSHPTAREYFENSVCDYYSTPNNLIWPNIRASKNKIRYRAFSFLSFSYFRSGGSGPLFVLPLLSYDGRIPWCKKVEGIVQELTEIKDDKITIRFHPYEDPAVMAWFESWLLGAGVDFSINDNSRSIIKNLGHFSAFCFFDYRTTAAVELAYANSICAYFSVSENRSELSTKFESSFFDTSNPSRGGSILSDRWRKVRKDFPKRFYGASFFYIFKFAWFVKRLGVFK